MTNVPADGPKLPLAEVQRAAERSRSTGPWSVAHLKSCWAVLVAVGGVTAVVAALVSGGRAAAGVGVGFGIVGAFFTVSTVMIAYVGARHPKAVLVTALATYLAKIVALGVVVVLMPADGPVAPRWMAVSVAIGLVAWMTAHLTYVAKAKIFYVDPH